MSRTCFTHELPPVDPRWRQLALDAIAEFEKARERYGMYDLQIIKHLRQRAEDLESKCFQ